MKAKVKDNDKVIDVTLKDAIYKSNSGEEFHDYELIFLDNEKASYAILTLDNNNNPKVQLINLTTSEKELLEKVVGVNIKLYRVPDVQYIIKYNVNLFDFSPIGKEKAISTIEKQCNMLPYCVVNYLINEIIKAFN